VYFHAIWMIIGLLCQFTYKKQKPVYRMITTVVPSKGCSIYFRDKEKAKSFFNMQYYLNILIFNFIATIVNKVFTN
jgi:hypothetical protein